MYSCTCKLQTPERKESSLSAVAVDTASVMVTSVFALLSLALPT